MSKRIWSWQRDGVGNASCVKCTYEHSAFSSFCPSEYTYGLYKFSVFFRNNSYLKLISQFPMIEMMCWFSLSTYKFLLSLQPCDCNGAHFPMLLYCGNAMTSRPRHLQKPRFPRCLCGHSLTSVSTTIILFYVLVCTLLFKMGGHTWECVLSEAHGWYPLCVTNPCRTLRTEMKGYLLRSEVENFNQARPAGQQTESKRVEEGSREEAEKHMTPYRNLQSSCAWYLITPVHRPMNLLFLKVSLHPKVHIWYRPSFNI